MPPRRLVMVERVAMVAGGLAGVLSCKATLSRAVALDGRSGAGQCGLCMAWYGE